MAPVPCPRCGKPVVAGTPVCRWCKTPIETPAPRVRTEPSPDAEHRLEAEIEELESWEAPPFRPVPAVSGGTWITLSICAVLIAASLAMPKGFEAGMITGWTAFAICLIALFMFAIEDYRLRNARTLRSPEETLRFFHTRIRGRNFAAAWTALPDYPLARERHADLPGRWQGHELWGPLEGTPSTFKLRIQGKRKLGTDHVVLTLTFELRHGVYLGTHPVGHLISAVTSEKESLTLLKLFVHRDGRWYLVNGTPGDSLDRRLSRALEAKL